MRPAAAGGKNQQGQTPGGKLVDEQGIKNVSDILENRDQLGPFKGYISPSPRTSVPGVAGINNALINVAINRARTVTVDTSHTEQP